MKAQQPAVQVIALSIFVPGFLLQGQILMLAKVAIWDTLVGENVLQTSLAIQRTCPGTSQISNRT